jgi:hypothetical protein
VGHVQLLQIYWPWSQQEHLVAPLAALTALNEVYLHEHPNTPHLYEAGVRYSREGKYRLGRQKEKWLPIPLLYILHHGDCEDLSAALAAFYRVKGINAIPVAIESSVGFHIVVRMPDGKIEDPSRVLGMGE